MPPFPASWIFLLSVYNWRGSAKSVSSQHKPRDFSYSIVDAEFQFVSEHTRFSHGLWKFFTNRRDISKRWVLERCLCLWMKRSKWVRFTISPSSFYCHASPAALGDSVQRILAYKEGELLGEHGKWPLGKYSLDLWNIIKYYLRDILCLI